MEVIKISENTTSSHCTKMFSKKDFFSKCGKIRRKLRIGSHLMKKSLMKNLIFCAVSLLKTDSVKPIAECECVIFIFKKETVILFKITNLYVCNSCNLLIILGVLCLFKSQNGTKGISEYGYLMEITLHYFSVCYQNFH